MLDILELQEQLVGMDSGLQIDLADALQHTDEEGVDSNQRAGVRRLNMTLDCCSRHAWARLYPNKLPLTAVQLINNDVLPTFEAHGTKIDAVLSDNGREFCGREDRHPYELFLQLEDIEHKRTRVNRPQSNGIVERWHRTLLDEHFRVEGRRTWFETIEEMQTVLDQYLLETIPSDPIRAAA